ncbi:hypothetical protein SCUP515_04422 [Seiridium cupressi]
MELKQQVGESKQETERLVSECQRLEADIENNKAELKLLRVQFIELIDKNLALREENADLVKALDSRYGSTKSTEEGSREVDENMKETEKESDAG